MNTITNEDAIVVLTARGLETILEEGGSQAWVLDAKRAAKSEYVVCVQNRGFKDDWGHVSAPHHTAFMVGRLKDVVHSKQEGSEHRWLLTFSEYAEIDISDAWPGHRNPVLYTSLKSLNIDLATLKFQPMPVQEPKAEPVGRSSGALTLSEAKKGLALTFGVEPSDIEITVRA